MENRYICYRGFDKVNNLAIKKINGGYIMNSTAVSFGIAPLVNAANRMNKNWDALKLFLSDDEEEIDELIKSLKYCKEKQNDKVDEIFAQIKEQAKSQEDKKVMFFVIKNVEDSAGVSGLLANKVLGQYQRPVVITQETVDQSGEEIYSGSLRATGVEDFSKMVNKTRYAKAMGHSNAAGFIAKKKNIDKFKDKIEEELKDVEFKQYATVDIQLTQRQISKELINNLSALNRISGQGFQPISVMIEDIDDYEVGYMSGGKHTKITTPYMMFIKWNSNDWEIIPDDASIAAIGTLEQGYIGRKFYYKMIINDYRIDERIDLDDI
jgi:single-stranded-DNA-specific exonuclease